MNVNRCWKMDNNDPRTIAIGHQSHSDGLIKASCLKDVLSPFGKKHSNRNFFHPKDALFEIWLKFLWFWRSRFLNVVNVDKEPRGAKYMQRF